MELIRNFLTTAATEAAEAAQETAGTFDGMIDMLDIFMLVMLLGFGLYGIYSAIRLWKEQMLFPNKFLYPGDCKPEECADEGGFIDYIIPRLSVLSVALLIMGIALGLNSYVFKFQSMWIDIATMVLPVGALVWYIICQRKAAKLFW